MRPSNVPAFAIALAADQAHFPAYQAQVVQSIIDEAGREDALALASFERDCGAWLVANERNRAMGLPLASKPLQRSAQKVISFQDNPTGVIYVWIELDSPMGSPCPDLSPLPTPPPTTNPRIVRRLVGNWFSTAADNRYPVDAPPISATADDGTSGVFQFFPSAMGLGSGWWLKVR